MAHKSLKFQGISGFCSVAERAGFEPACGCPQTDFESLKYLRLGRIWAEPYGTEWNRKPTSNQGFLTFQTFNRRHAANLCSNSFFFKNGRFVGTVLELAPAELPKSYHKTAKISRRFTPQNKT